MTYIEKKRQAGEKVGVDVEIHKLDNTNTQELVSLIGKLNEDSSVTGIILQLPLPKDINEYKICSAIDPSKDVDGLNPVSMGDIWLNKKPKIIPATVKAIDYILQYIAKEEGQEYHD